LGTTAVWGLYVQNSLGIGLGAVDLLVQGATGFNLDPTNPGISPADSLYRVSPIAGQPWDALIINNNNFPAGMTIAPAGATTRLGAFLPGDLPYLLPGETPDPTGPGSVLGGSIFDVSLKVIVPLRIDRASSGICDPGGCPISNSLIFTVPEPVVPLTALVPAALAVLAFARRRTSCV
jgi:hypothetical protein